ncbi:MAG: GGDEF domain-containing protein, partial [Phycisphaerae bacterium]|nr:GGDEF domain-containing protein [Phycisphaerae bacterium]
MSTLKNNSSSTASAQRGILLLGDDGRMAGILKSVLKGHDDYYIHSEPHALHGIIQLYRKPYHLTFLNAEQTDQKTHQAAAAIKQVAPEVPLFLYGQAYAEIFSQPALQCKDAQDFLTWPVPHSQVKQLLGILPENSPVQPPSPTEETPDPYRSQTLSLDSQDPDTLHHSVRSQLLHSIHQLAQLIPHGRSIIALHAEELLSELFQVAWVKICPVCLSHDNNAQDNGYYQYKGHHAIGLTGPDGPMGHMILGPRLRDQSDASTLEILKKNRTSIYQTGSMIGTLLYLAQRDEHLRHLATVDELTSAYNRRYLEYFMRQVIKKSEHEHTEVTLLLFDIDNFKHYNDTYGHAAGDDILRQATILIKRCCREHDVVARIGGDEFAVLF